MVLSRLEPSGKVGSRVVKIRSVLKAILLVLHIRIKFHADIPNIPTCIVGPPITYTFLPFVNRQYKNNNEQ